MPQLLLASASPRRQALLRQVGIPVEARATAVDEAVPAGVPPAQAVLDLARRKVDAAVAQAAPGTWVLAADTLGEVDGAPLGKPRDAEDAARMLGRLQGRAHVVHTGLCVRRAGEPGEWTRVVSTRVAFTGLTGPQIRAYVGTGEPLDKAGAYAIQGLAGAYVASLEGDYSNVVGLPLAATVSLLREAGFPLPAHL